MERLGWKRTGLGKFEQGILHPLWTEVKGKRGEGRIINNNINYDCESYPTAKKP